MRFIAVAAILAVHACTAAFASSQAGPRGTNASPLSVSLWPKPQHCSLSGELLQLDLAKLKVVCKPNACTQVLQDAVKR